MKLQIEVTNHCNLACAMCPHAIMKRPKAHMPWETFTRVIDMAKAEGFLVEWLHLYGEPFLWPHLVDGIKYMKEKGVGNTNISTNMMAYTEELGQALLDAKVDMILCCVDSLVPEVYQKLRGGNLTKVLSGVSDLIKRSEKTQTKVLVQRMISTLTTDQDMKRFAAAFRGRVIDKKCGRITNDRDFAVKAPEDKRRECKMLELWLSVLVDSTVVPCCWDYDKVMPIGNIFDNTLLDMWAGPKIQRMRQDLKAGRYDNLPLCTDCYGEGAD